MVAGPPTSTSLRYVGPSRMSRPQVVIAGAHLPRVHGDAAHLDVAAMERKAQRVGQLGESDRRLAVGVGGV